MQQWRLELNLEHVIMLLRAARCRTRPGDIADHSWSLLV